MAETEVLDELSQHEGFLLRSEICARVEKRGVHKKSASRAITQLCDVNALDILLTSRGHLYRLKDNVRYRLEKQNGKK